MLFLQFKLCLSVRLSLFLYQFFCFFHQRKEETSKWCFCFIFFLSGFSLPYLSQSAKSACILTIKNLLRLYEMPTTTRRRKKKTIKLTKDIKQ